MKTGRWKAYTINNDKKNLCDRYKMGKTEG